MEKTPLLTIHQQYQQVAIEQDINARIITVRSADIDHLQQQYQDLHHMMGDLQQLIHQQDPLIDDIRNNVVKANTKVETGVKELVKANKEQHCTRRKLCCFALVLVVLAAITLSILLALHPITNH